MFIWILRALRHEKEMLAILPELGMMLPTTLQAWLPEGHQMSSVETRSNPVAEWICIRSWRAANRCGGALQHPIALSTPAEKNRYATPAAAGQK